MGSDENLEATSGTPAATSGAGLRPEHLADHFSSPSNENSNLGFNPAKAHIFSPKFTHWYRNTFFRSAPFIGIACALFMYAAAWGPSLLPRGWGFQGILAGFCAAVGFGLGFVFGKLIDTIMSLTQAKFDPRVRDICHILAWIGTAGIVFGYPFRARLWQIAIANQVGMKPISIFGVIIACLLAIAIFAGLIFMWGKLAQACKRIKNRLLNRTNRLLAWSGGILGSFGVTLACLVLVIQSGLFLAERVFYNAFYQEETWLTPPTSPFKSGSSQSYEKWDKLSSQGRSFVAKGASKEMIEEVTQKPALEPIRVYAGLDNRSIDQVADAVVAELERTGAFDRTYLLIATTTGSGNVNHWAATSFEYLTGGDCAIAGMQHALAPSAFQFLSDRRSVTRAAGTLYDKINAKLARLPMDKRPKVYLHAESIGAFGFTSVFDDFTEMYSSVDGAMFMGTPDFTPMTQSLVSKRSSWSSAFSPVVNDGRRVRFVANPDQISTRPNGQPYPRWESDKRVIFLAHESDPIVRWDWKLALLPPVWLQEPRPDTIGEPMTWIPLVTFLQVGIDMASSMKTPPNEGHLYHSADIVPTWGAILDVGEVADYTAIANAVSEQHGR